MVTIFFNVITVNKLVVGTFRHLAVNDADLGTYLSM